MKRSFSGWREGFRYYAPVLCLGVLLSVGLFPLGYVWIGVLVLLIGVAMTLFFRDFPRSITAAPNEVVAPADGTIVAVEDLETSPHYDGPCRRISIFLSIFNVHVNRAPYEGEVAGIRYQPGLFKDARKAETTHVNESNTIRLATSRGPMTVRQISGAVARRIVCPLTEGALLAKGEKFGMIRFGSRTELYLPPGTEICVTLKDKVQGGKTVVARFDD